MEVIHVVIATVGSFTPDLPVRLLGHFSGSRIQLITPPGYRPRRKNGLENDPVGMFIERRTGIVFGEAGPA